VWRLRQAWDAKTPTNERMRRFAKEILSLADVSSVIDNLATTSPHRRFGLAEEHHTFDLDFEDAVSF
jgi:hypothetical protein